MRLRHDHVSTCTIRPRSMKGRAIPLPRISSFFAPPVTALHISVCGIVGKGRREKWGVLRPSPAHRADRQRLARRRPEGPDPLRNRHDLKHRHAVRGTRDDFPRELVRRRAPRRRGTAIKSSLIKSIVAYWIQFHRAIYAAWW